MVLCGATVRKKSKNHFIISKLPKGERVLAFEMIKRYSKDFLIEVDD